ncbi:MAG TPA: ABC transporter substrate-binding protein, partial [Casimicrobiaceae bacterium]
EPAALAAKRATGTIPIVVLALGDPVGIGLVPSLAKPGGNVTGVSFISSDLTSKRLQFALECVPKARRLAVLWDVRNTNSRAEARAVQDAARSRGIDVALLTARTDQEFARRLDGVARERPDLLYVTFEGGLVAANRTRIAELGLRERIPVVSGWHALTEAGALMSYAPDIAAMFRRAAYHVDRILKGARPGDLPIELPTKVDLVLNQRTAIALGVRFPQDMLTRAERVIA